MPTTTRVGTDRRAAMSGSHRVVARSMCANWYRSSAASCGPRARRTWPRTAPRAVDVRVAGTSPRPPPVAGQVGRDHVLGLGAQPLPVVEEFGQRRLVGDHRVHQVGVGLREGQHGDRAAAGAEDGRRTGVDVDQQPGEVVGPQFRGRVTVRVVQPAAVDAARVGGQHGVLGGEQVGHRFEGRGVHRGGDEASSGTAPRSS